MHEAVVERWEALKKQKPQKSLKKMNRRDIDRMAKIAAIEDLRPPNITYRKEKEKEKEFRKRMRRAGHKMTQNMKRRKTS